MKTSVAASAWTTGKLAAVAAVTGTGMLLTGAGVYAALNATANNPVAQAVDSGTLKLVMAANGAGFGSPIAGLAPGDVVNRHVQLTNSGTLPSEALTLGVVDATPTTLSTNATTGLQVAVSQCSVAWTAGTGACAGITTALIAATSVSALRTTPGTLIAGAIPAGTVIHLQLKVTLPNSAETTINGTPIAGTVQGLTSALTWNFSEVQRAAATTSS